MMMNFSVYCKNGYNGGIYIDDDFVLDRTFFTDDERIEILAALQEFDHLKEENSQLVKKMVALFNLDIIDWIEVDLNSWYQNNDLNKKFNDLKKANRVFRLSRILKLNITDKIFNFKNIDLTQLKNNLITDTNKEVEVTLQFDRQIANVVFDEFNHGDIVEQQNGDFIVTMKVSNTH